VVDRWALGRSSKDKVVVFTMQEKDQIIHGFGSEVIQ